MPSLSRLLDWVGQTRGYNVPSPTTQVHDQNTCVQCGMFVRLIVRVEWEVTLLGKVMVGCQGTQTCGFVYGVWGGVGGGEVSII